jgi:hypothetical protein
MALSTLRNRILEPSRAAQKKERTVASQDYISYQTFLP